jgi:hypothetical protein
VKRDRRLRRRCGVVAASALRAGLPNSTASDSVRAGQRPTTPHECPSCRRTPAIHALGLTHSRSHPRRSLLGIVRGRPLPGPDVAGRPPPISIRRDSPAQASRCVTNPRPSRQCVRPATAGIRSESRSQGVMTPTHLSRFHCMVVMHARRARRGSQNACDVVVLAALLRAEQEYLSLQPRKPGEPDRQAGLRFPGGDSS